MITRHALSIAAVLWAAIALVVGLRAFQSVNDDARALVLAACVLGSGAAMLAALGLAGHHDRLAGTLLVVSVFSPTVFAWALNIPALLIGVALIARPSHVVRASANRPA